MIVAPRIVAVDDTLEHLQALRRAFGALGGLCECLEAHEAQDRQTPFRNGVRVLFMDINLLPGAGLDVSARTFSPIMSIIRKLISAENGPYALVTWTNNPNAHDALSNHLQEHLDPTLRPSATFCLSKPDYLDDGPSLIEKLKTLQNELPGLSMLLDWEAAVIAAHHKLDSHEERLEAGHTSNVNAWRRSDWTFHQALISACGSRVLMQTHAEVFDKYLRYQMIALAFRPSASRPEHRALMEAALRRDVDGATTLLRHHIQAGVQHALGLGNLNSIGDGQPTDRP